MNKAQVNAALADAVRMGRITAVDNNSPLQNVTVDVRVGVIDTNVPRLQEYGFSSNPAAGDSLMGVEVTVNGNRFVIAIDDMGNRPQGGEAGDVWMYHREGHMIHMTKDKIINVECEKLNMIVPETTWTGKIILTGDIEQDGKHTSTGDQIAGNVSQIHHDHDYHPGPGALTPTSEANPL